MPQRPNAALLQRVREVAVSGSVGLFKQALDAADDLLFGFSEKSESTAERGHFMDAMRSIRVKRPAMEQTFREQLSNGFLEFARNHGHGALAAKEKEIESDSLSLVEEQDLEEDLAVAAMAAKANVRHNSALFALNQRLAAVTGAKEVSVESNPVAPPGVCRALRVVIGVVEADITVKLVILKLFDRHVVTDLDHVYDETNRLLAEAGVLPHIKYVRPTRVSGESPTPKPGAAGEAAASASTADTGTEAPADAATNEVVAAFASLLASRRQKAPGGEVRRASGPSISNTDLIAALSRLQLHRPEFDAPAGDAQALVHRIEGVKQDLLSQLRQSGIEQPHERVAAADEDAIDLVSMLFQFVVQDRNLPAEIQAVLSRLQIPYVRVAIKDKHLFAQNVHPARQMLDALAIASVGWSREGDRDGRLLGILNKIVNQVLEEYADDFSLFDELIAEFETFIDKQTRHSEAAEQRTAEAAKGRERLAIARRTATHVAESRIARRQLPPLAREVILNPWTNYLVLTHLRQGPDSAEWKSAVNFIDAVVWSSLPKTQEADIARLKTVLPQMLLFLRKGLGVVGFGDNESERLAQGFEVLFQSMHQREVALEHVQTIADAERSLGSPARKPAIGVTADIEIEAEHTDSNLDDDDEFVLRVRALKIGTWIEFTDDTGHPERAKISWISALSARLLFVNRKGLKVAEMSVFALAKEFRAGTAQVLEVAPIFERALTSIMNKLKYEHLLSTGGKAIEDAPHRRQV